MECCEHGVTPTLWTDLEALHRWGINPDCLECVTPVCGDVHPDYPEGEVTCGEPINHQLIGETRHICYSIGVTDIW